MAGPWEKYGGNATEAPAGPWSRYAPPAEAVATVTPTEKLAGGRAPVGVVSDLASRDQRKEAYKEMAKGAMDRTGAVADTGFTVTNALGRVNPFSADMRAGMSMLGLGGDMGVGKYAEDYHDALDRTRAIDDAATERSPVTSIGAQVVGSLALPTFGAAVNTVKGSAALGAGYGAAYGAGAGDGVADRVTRAAGGALAGGAIGAAVPPIVSGVQAVAQGARRAISPIVGAFDPEIEAARRVQMALARDAKIGSTGVAPSAVTAPGSQLVVADIGGETTRALARSAANSSPEARAALEGAIRPRFEQQTERVADTVTSLSPLGANATKTLEQLQSAARAANRPAYARAFAQGSGGVWDDTLAGLAEAPIVQQAIKDATKAGANRAAAEGFPAIKNPFTILDDGSVALVRQPDGSVALPNLQFWDIVKRNLDDAYKAAQRSGNANAATDILSLKNQIVGRLDQLVPSYARARQGAAAAFGAEDALEAGKKFVFATGKNAEYAPAIAKMTLPEKELFREGFASELRARILEIRDGRSVINAAFLQSSAARQRIEMAFGKAGAGKLEAQLRLESIMDALRLSMGNSTTARQLTELGLSGGIGGVGGYLTGGDLSSITAGSIAGGLVRYGGGRIDQRVSQKVGEMLASSKPEDIAKLANMAAKSPALMTAIRRFHDGLAKLAGPVAPNEATGRFISGLSPSRADSEQPDKR